MNHDSRLGLFGSLAVLSLLCVGCASSEQHRKGRELADQGDYDAAITNLREATTADPGNPQYQMDLADTQMAAAEKHVQAAEKLLAENKATPARAEVTIALEYAPAHPRALRLAGETDGRIEQAKESARQSEAALQAQQWADALMAAMEAAKADAANPEAQTALARAKASAEAHHITVTEAPPAAVASARNTRKASAAKPARRPAADRPAPRQRVATAPPPAPTAPAADAFRGTLSRDDDRYPKKMETLDGITVRLDDTDHEPLNADVTISVGRYKLTRKHVRVGMPVYGRGASGRSYRMIIEGITPDSETIHFRIEAVSPGAAYREQM